MNTTRKILSGTCAAVAAIATASSLAFADSPAQGRQPVRPGTVRQRIEQRRQARKTDALVIGRVKSINGTALQVQSGQAPLLMITTDTATAFNSPAGASTLGAIASGDRVMVLLTQPLGNATTAQALAVTVLPAPETIWIGGKASALTANSLTVATRTINISGTTKIIVAGVNKASIKDIAADSGVLVFGAPDASGALAAELIVVKAKQRDNLVAGAIASINGSTLLVYTPKGEQITINAADTVIFASHSSAGTLADLKVGRVIAVFGTRNADGTVAAQLIAAPKIFGK